MDAYALGSAFNVVGSALSSAGYHASLPTPSRARRQGRAFFVGHAMSQSYSKWKVKQASTERRRERMEAARALGRHTKAEWLAIMERYDHRCVCCGYGEYETGWRPNKDHIVPVADGGSDSADNLQPLCRPCNTSKMCDTANWRAYRDKHGWADVEYEVA